MKCGENAAKGFSFIELVIALGIIVILGMIAVPSYVNYQRRENFLPVVQAVELYKTAVNGCYQKLKTLSGCNAGSNSIPAAITTTKDAVAKLTVINGVIIATPVAEDGIVPTDTYMLTPTVTKGGLVWQPSGGSVTDGYN